LRIKELRFSFYADRANFAPWCGSIIAARACGRQGWTSHDGCGKFLNGQFGECLHYAYGFEADRDDLADEAQDVLRVVFAVGVVGDATAFVG
jgi:hypothetical protein